MKPEQLVEWFEAYRMFGVTKFNVYNVSISPELDSVFRYYLEHKSDDTLTEVTSVARKGADMSLGNSNKERDALHLHSPNSKDSSASKDKFIFKSGIESAVVSPQRNLKGIDITDKVTTEINEEITTTGSDDAVADMVQYEDALLRMHHLPQDFNDFTDGALRISSTLGLNDCMLRQMHASRFVINVDFDEIIVPRQQTNYSTMLSHIDATLKRTKSHHTYSFRNTYFFQNQTNDESHPVHLRTLRQRHSAPPSPYLFGAKSFVDPRTCKSVFHHYCWVWFKRSPHPLSIDVSAEIARSHHYRYRCPLSKEHCAKLVEEQSMDDVMIKYGAELKRSVEKVLRAIGLL
jgi:hypothetical protein